MRKLLHANFSRLLKSKIFWICGAIILAISVINAFNTVGYTNRLLYHGKAYIDGFMFTLAPYTAIFSAVFITLFVGTEYADKTIRNKLIIGHTRTNIYLADFIICFAGSVMLLVLWFVGMLPALFDTDGFEMGFSGVLKYFIIAVGFTAVFCSLFVMIGTLAPNRTLAVVLVMAFWFALIFLGDNVVYKIINLDFEKMFIFENGKYTIIGEAREQLITYRMLSRVNPAGQALLMAMVAYGNLSYGVGDLTFDLGPLYTSSLLDIVFSIVITVIITAVGIFFFRRKDFK